MVCRGCCLVILRYFCSGRTIEGKIVCAASYESMGTLGPASERKLGNWKQKNLGGRLQGALELHQILTESHANGPLVGLTSLFSLPSACINRRRKTTLQRKSHLCIPFLGTARPQSQFPHSCVCERFIYSQDRSTYFLQ